ncbi:MAG: hypothetical protein CENE_01009 [Candidatus Celerinatantimonas neptuna]|nr:MAG: hypothetical protein CENE_01009 [Candidatus Celerinatantimonas neptuna]
MVCSAFSGESGECKVAVGGVSGCCEKPSNISLADYLTMIMAVPKLDGAVMSLSKNNLGHPLSETSDIKVYEVGDVMDAPLSASMRQN